MKNKIEIQILSPTSREKLLELRNEIRKIDGLETFELQFPPVPVSPGKMDAAVGLIILDAVIAGITHFTAEKSAEYFQHQIATISKKVLGKTTVDPGDKDEPMSGANTGESEGWKFTISDNLDGRKSVTSYDETGAVKLYSNREYSIDPEHTFALLIGTGEYEDRANFSPIPPVKGNLDEMYRVLTEKTLVGLPFENITRLYNESCINIKEALRNVSRINQIKTLIIYYSGHGQNTGNNQLSLIAKDTRNIDEELHNDIPYAFVEKMMNLSQADQKIVFIDACHSGLAAQGNSNLFDFAPVLGTFTLASTSADDSSYFKRNADNTYFTGFLTEAFKLGLANSSTMLSLQDLYNYTSQQLSKTGLPSPVCKAQLKNITPEKFYISDNPSFSLEARLGMPKQLYQQGRYEEARREYILLEKEYPENQQLRNEHIEFERNAEFNRLVKEGDLKFFTEKNFRGAQQKYQEALGIKYDENIRDKIADCEKSLLEQPQQFKSILEQGERKAKTEERNGDFRKDRQKEENRKSSMIIRIAVISISVLSLISYLLTRHKELEFPTYKYTGEIKELEHSKTPDGYGVAVYRNGDCYKGDWLDGLWDGAGTYIYDNGSVYKGHFSKGHFHGNGQMTYQNGTTYDGEWNYNSWQGYGHFKDKDGNTYDGNYVNGYRNGRGKFVWADGQNYDGDFKDDYRDGFGTFISLTGTVFNCPGCRKYIGNWKKGLKQGDGKCFDSEGKLIYSGTFNNDMPLSPAYPSQ